MLQNLRKIKSRFRNQTGITLIEVMVSLLLFGIALSAIIFTINTNLITADSLRNNTIAAGLAQEGLEIVRNIRDNEWLSSGTFGNNLPIDKFEVQWDTSTLVPVTDLRFLKKDQSTGLFSYDTGIDTIFKRKIVIERVSTEESMVTVFIEWSNHGVAKSLQAEDHLFNWY